MKKKLYFRQFHAGYVLDAVWKLYEKNFEDSLDWRDVWRFNSTFEARGTFDLEVSSREPIFAVAENIVSRGFPTRAPYTLEKYYAEKYSFLTLHKDEINSLYGEIDITEQQLDCFRRAMFLVDPDSKPETLAPEDLVYLDGEGNDVPSSFAERLFMSQKIVREFGPEFGYLPQIMDTQRSVESLVDYPGKRAKDFSKIARIVLDNSLTENKEAFYAQRTDFALQFPAGGSYHGEDGIVIEVDGRHHETPLQQLLDKKRDSVLEEAGWARTIRYPATGEIPESSLNLLRAFLNHPYAEGIRQNYNCSLCASSDGKTVSDIVWGSLQVARLTKSLLRAIQAGALDLDQSNWTIFILEQEDFEWSLLAIKEFIHLASDLLLVEGRGRVVPDILLSVKQCSTGKRTSYIVDNSEHVEVEDDPSVCYDLAIDTSILKRRITIRQSSLQKDCDAKHYLWLRSAYAPVCHSEVVCDNSIYYEPLLKVEEDKEPIVVSEDRVEALVRLLQTIFRKSEFREKQLDVLNLALRHSNVIALLPTGAGKSLIFQMAAFLQPGISIVVGPLKALMTDQIQNLINHQIDVSFAINSNLNAEEKQRAMKEFKRGQYQLFYLSPERFLIDDFRIVIKEMKEKNGKWCQYCVVDEAHCVSEWGHDFRTSYLRLGDNARRLIPTSDNWNVTMMALTGTASYDVLADMQRELGIKERLSVITPKSFRRDELNFHVELVPSCSENKAAMHLSRKENTIAILEKIPALLDSNETFVDFVQPSDRKTNAGLLFCPHARGGFGVNSSDWEGGFYSFLTQKLKCIAPVIGKFTGKDDSEDNERNQRLFKENELSLLVATKAFGMGVDKPNIRYTLHTCMPSSIEAFYQEAGRAGRDRKKSVCIVLYQPSANEKPSPDIGVLEWFHNNAYPSPEIDYKKAESLFLEKSYFLNSIKASIRNQIEETFGLSISFENLGNGLQVFSWDQTGVRWTKIIYGIIFYSDPLEIQVTSCPRLGDEAKSLVLKQIRDEIASGMEDLKMQSVYELLNDYRREETQDSMASILENMKDGQKSRRFIIDFEGNSLTLFILSVFERWKRRTGRSINQITFNNMRNAFLEYKKKSKKVDEFVQNVAIHLSRHQNKFIEDNDYKRSSIERVFYQMRDSGDTSKIVYRLSILGVIEDYEVDYKTNVIIARLAKLTPKEYKEKLAEYLSRYESPEYIAKQKLEQISNAQTVTDAVKIALKKLIDFTYDKIAKKRMAQTELMSRTVEKGSQGSEQFAEEIYGYFEAKYVEELRNHVCNRNVIYDYSQVEYWLNQRLKEDETGAYHDNVSHLRGTCNRLISEGESENPILYLLRSFALLVNPAYNRKDGLEDLRTGWTLYSKYKELSIEECARLMKKLNSRILSDVKDTELANLLNDEVEGLYIDKMRDKLNELHQELSHVNRALWG